MVSLNGVRMTDADVQRIARELAVPKRARAADAARLVRGGDFVFDEPSQIPALWGEGERVLWAEGEGLMLAGPQGLGKTTIAQQILAARAGLHDAAFLGLPVRRSNGVALYLAMDRPRQAARSLLRMIRAEQRDLLNQQVAVWKGPLPVDPTSSSNAVADWVQNLDPSIDLVIVDSLKDYAAGDLSSGELGSQINSSFQELIARGIQIIVLHHNRKAGAGASAGTSLDDIYGSTFLTGGLGSVLLLRGTQGDPEVTMHHVKQPAEEVGPLQLLHHHSRGFTQLRAVETVESVLRASSVPLSAAEIAGLVGCSHKTALRHVQALVRQGMARQVTEAEPSGRGRRPATFIGTLSA